MDDGVFNATFLTPNAFTRPVWHAKWFDLLLKIVQSILPNRNLIEIHFSKGKIFQCWTFLIKKAHIWFKRCLRFKFFLTLCQNWLKSEKFFDSASRILSIFEQNNRNSWNHHSKFGIFRSITWKCTFSLNSALYVKWHFPHRHLLRRYVDLRFRYFRDSPLISSVQCF